MKWRIRILLIVTAVLLVAGIVFMSYLLRSRNQANEYQFQIDANLAAASVANSSEPLTDPAKAVIAEYEGRRTVVVPGNYLALSSYLRKDAVMPFLARVDKNRALKITFCEAATLYAVPVDASGDKVIIQLETQGRSFTMHIRGGNLWTNLLACCMDGTYHDQNLPLE